MLAALAFLTPIGGARRPDGRTFAWFPVVGALLGATLGLLWLGADRWWPPAVVGALVVVADLGLTGMLHLDGLVDAADGLLPHLDRERRLEVMADPTIGAFALAVASGTLLLRFAALASIRPDVALLAGLWCASRTLMAVTARTVPYARAGGLAAAFQGGGAIGIATLGTAGSVALVLAASGPVARGPVALAAAVAAGVGVVALGRRKLGGYTGDVLGAAGVVAETVGLLVAAARW